MRPTSIKRTAPDVLSITWDDGTAFIVPLKLLRDQCPCAVCSGETLLLGKQMKAPPPPMLPGRNELVALTPVGSYALGATWKDGHNTGLYTWEHLHDICEASTEGRGHRAEGTEEKREN